MKQLIPTFIQQQEADGRRHGVLQAHTLFIDLSGFTPLTESLMREGNAGAERLSNILNEIFEPLVRLVYARGGFIPYFAGDAFTAIFPEEAPQGGVRLVETAMMARELFRERENRFGRFTIGLKFGLGYGEVEWGIVGGEQRAYYFRGAPIDGCAFSQTMARDQDIVLGNDLLSQLPDGFLRLKPVSDDHYRVQGLLPLPPTPRAADLPPLSEGLARHYLPEAVITYSQEGEFRPVVSVFLSFAGIREHLFFDDFATVVLNQVHTFSGYFKEIDFGDKGGLMAIFFGAPVAFENNVNRALEFVLSLREELAPLAEIHGFRVRVGLTVGTAFTGIVGGRERCQYACVGSRVNLAARLMGFADWGEVLVAEEIHKAAAFRFVHRGDIHYKGIKSSVPTYKLLGRHFGDELRYEGELVGRQTELTQLADFAQPLFQGRNAGVAYIYGEAGVGKSRLTFELRRVLTGGDRLAWRQAQADEILRKPFNPFIYWMRNYFGLSVEFNAATNQRNFDQRFEQLRGQLETLPPDLSRLVIRELDRTRSILAAQLGMHAAGSLWEQLNAQGRYRNTLSAIINLILAESLVQPIVFEVEDVHWIDQNSLELIRELVRAMVHYPIMLLVTSRYKDDGVKQRIIDPDLLQELRLPQLEIDLNALSEEAVRLFAEKSLRGPISDEFLRLLLRTTNANPFYLEQVLEYFAENELLHHDQAGGWTIQDENVKLSNSINAILTARIDRLSKQVRDTVKAAAVIGREFEIPVLSEVMKTQEGFVNRRERGPLLLREEIETAERVQIWRAMNELRYIFRHSLLREAVYGMQLHTRLRRLHQLIAEAIERLYADQIEERYADLAFHYEQADVFDKTREYLRKAADYARDNYQNQQALAFYEKLLDQLGTQAGRTERVHAQLRRGKLLEVLGNWEESEAALKQALHLAKVTHDALLLGQANNELGHLLLLKGEYEEAKPFLHRAVSLFESIDDKTGLAQAYGNLGNLFFRQGAYDDAQAYFERSIESGYTSQAVTDGALIVANLALTHMNRGNYDQGIQAIQQQLPLHRRENDKQGLATLLVNLGIVQYEKGDFAAARLSYEEGLALAEELGNKQLVSIAIGCLGSVFQQQGDYDRAMELFEQDLDIAEELGDKQGTAIALGLIGELLSVRGDFHRAIEYLQKNLMLCEELGYQKGIAKAVNTLGDIFYFLEQYDRSLHFYDRAIDVTRKIGNRLVLAASLIEKGLVMIKLGRAEALPPLEEEALAIARELGNPDLLFDAQLLRVRTFILQEEREQALHLLETIRENQTEAERLAEIDYLTFRAKPDDEAARLRARAAFTALYAQTPKYLYRRRLEALEA